MHRRLAVLGRVLLFAARYKPAWVAGTATLSLAKILENMEIGHNVMHGQWDWMHDPYIHSSSWDWDSASTPEAWKHSHNYIHHTYTNIRGKDKDLGYKIMRIDPHQKWVPVYLLQPALQRAADGVLRVGRGLPRPRPRRDPQGREVHQGAQARAQGMARKAGHQIAKDYLAYPLLSGRKGFKSTLTANITANIIRNVGARDHLLRPLPGPDVHVQRGRGRRRDARALLRPPAARLREHRGQPALPRHQRQPRLQVEHHPLPRHAEHALLEIAPQVQEICERYDLPALQAAGRSVKQWPPRACARRGRRGGPAHSGAPPRTATRRGIPTWPSAGGGAAATGPERCSSTACVVDASTSA